MHWPSSAGECGCEASGLRPLRHELIRLAVGVGEEGNLLSRDSAERIESVGQMPIDLIARKSRQVRVSEGVETDRHTRLR